MATYTTNYNLKKPAGTELIKVSDINGNMDIIDTAMKTISDDTGHRIDSKLLTVSSSVSQYKVNLPNSCMAFLIGTTSSISRCWAVIAITYSSGAVYTLELGKGSGVTFSTETGKLVVGTSSSGTATVWAFSNSSTKLADISVET